ncbi:glycosyltransferase family 4 protein [Aquabacterium sp. A7-Y]|uniref:glycosyltransferase family 4 protein n=1 Tax=Aquabacterium sp. A7-Y TaxID=1349605 RepID=UPI00223C9977|nr:glycosyltransferase family 4 protein [Aquabacterium sp. A7-Y]MCW7537304.1 glycosyltransferase family 4 protein [Aquabacterium sp. A7-Y]
MSVHEAPLHAASSEVVLVSHGFQTHYEQGFANGLAENGLPVTLLGSDETLASRLHPGVQLLNIRGSQDSRRSRWRKAHNMLLYHLRLLATVWQRRRATVMIIGMLGPEWLVGVIEGLLLRLISARLTLTVHNILPHNRHTATMKRLYWIIYRIPHLLLVHTDATRQALIDDFGIAPDRVLVMEHGLNDSVERLPLSKPDAKAALGADPQRPAVLFFGYVSPFKGIDLLIDAIEQREDITLIVAGRCAPGEYGDTIRRRLEALQPSGKLVWMEGFLAEADIARAFAAADATVLPYRHIDQSGVLLLSLSQGVPVIATQIGGFAEVVEPSNGLFIREPSAEAVGEALDSFVSQPRRFRPAEVMGTVEHLAWRRTVKGLLRWLSAGGVGDGRRVNA